MKVHIEANKSRNKITFVITIIFIFVFHSRFVLINLKCLIHLLIMPYILFLRTINLQSKRVYFSSFILMSLNFNIVGHFEGNNCRLLPTKNPTYIQVDIQEFLLVLLFCFLSNFKLYLPEL